MAKPALHSRIAGRLSGSLARQDWMAVFIELLVVVFGILLALELNDWAQARERRSLEHTYLVRLRDDLQLERADDDHFREVVQGRITAAALLDKIAKNPATKVADPRMVPWAIETVSWRSFPTIHNISYGELQSTGQTNLIRSVALRRALADHYGKVADYVRQGNDRTTENRFDAATAGLLSAEELVSVEMATGDHHRMPPVSASRAAEIETAFSRRRAAVDELPDLAQHHMFNLRVIGQMRSRIDALIALIDRQIGAPPRSASGAQ